MMVTSAVTSLVDLWRFDPYQEWNLWILLKILLAVLANWCLTLAVALGVYFALKRMLREGTVDRPFLEGGPRHGTAGRIADLASWIVIGQLLLALFPSISEAPPEAAGREEILVATMPLAAGALLRAPHVTWQAIGRPAERGEIVRPAAAIRAAQPKADEEVRSEVYGAALRRAVSPGDPIRRGGIVKPGDRDFLEIVLSPGARAFAIPSASSSTRWPTISAISFGRWRCRRRWSRGR